MGRAIDQAGFNFWLSVLDRGDVSPPAFILEIIRGAKAPSPDGASPEFAAQKAADVAYLENKTDIGLYFSAVRGMSNVQQADQVMQLYNGSAESIIASKSAIDEIYSDASDAFGGDFLIELVGVVEDPFLT